MTIWTNEEINESGTVKLYNNATTTYDAIDTKYNGKSVDIWSLDSKNTTSWSNEAKNTTSWSNEAIT